MLALLALAALAVVGCSTPHLAGTNDAALEYVVEPDPSTGETLDGPLTAAGVKARLASGQGMADVDPLGTGGCGARGTRADAPCASRSSTPPTRCSRSGCPPAANGEPASPRYLRSSI